MLVCWLAPQERAGVVPLSGTYQGACRMRAHIEAAMPGHACGARHITSMQQHACRRQHAVSVPRSECFAWLKEVHAAAPGWAGTPVTYTPCSRQSRLGRCSRRALACSYAAAARGAPCQIAGLQCAAGTSVVVCRGTLPLPLVALTTQNRCCVLLCRTGQGISGQAALQQQTLRFFSWRRWPPVYCYAPLDRALTAEHAHTRTLLPPPCDAAVCCSCACAPSCTGNPHLPVACC